MTIQQFASVGNDVRRQRRLKLGRRRLFQKDVVLSIFPFPILLLLLSGRHLPRLDAFQFRSIQNIPFLNTPSIGKSKSANTILFPSRERARQQQFQYESSALSLSSPSIDGRSESGKNSTGAVGIDTTSTKDKEIPVLSTKAEESTLPADAVAEATALRAMAKELRAEARAMELDIKQRASKEKEAKNAVIDEMIETLFLPLQYQDPQSNGLDSTPNNDSSTSVAKAQQESLSPAATSQTRIPDARVVGDRMRQGKFTREQVLSVVDRLFEKHHEAIDGAIQQEGMTFSNISQAFEESGPIQQGNQVSVDGQYYDYFHVLVQAASFLDLTFDEAVTKSSTPESTTSASSSSTPREQSSPSAFNVSTSSFPEPSFVTSGSISKAIRSRIGELREFQKVEWNRKIAEGTSTNKVVNVSSSLGWSHQYVVGRRGNSTKAKASASRKGFSGGTPSFIPMWIPSTYIPYIASLNEDAKKSSEGSPPQPTSNATNANVPFAIVHNSTLERAELDVLKNEVLLGSRFYVTSVEYAPGAALFRGNMRAALSSLPEVVPSLQATNQTQSTFDNNTAMVFEDIQERLKGSGLADKVQLFVLPDPEAIYRAEEANPSRNKPTFSRRPHIEASMDPPEEPVILALPKKLTPDESKLKKAWIQKIGKSLSYPIAALSMFLYSLRSFALNPHFFDTLVMQRDATVLRYCIPLIVGFLSVQVIHEMAHYFVAKRKKIEIGFPVPLSTPFYSNLPFFGCITPLRSFPPNRAALVDFALSGPMAALAASLLMVLGGVALTSSASPGQIARFPFLSVHAMKSNFLLGSILSWLLPKTMMLPLAQPIPMHPLFVIGRFGMISSALNLLPIFRLDGGRACFAVMGQRQGAVISAFTMLWIMSSFFMNSSMLLVWTLMVAIFQMRVEIPCRDECTEVGGKREFLWLFSFLLSMSILVPFPHRGMH